MRPEYRLCFLGVLLLLGILGSAVADPIKDAFDEMERNGCVAARASWMPLAERGDAVAQFDVGLSWQFGGDWGCPPHDNWQAAKWYKMAADQGSPDAADALASLYYSGDGAGQNFSEAMRLWRIAAAKGDVGANFFIGLLFQEGKGVPQNDIEAARWFRKAADEGDIQAQGMMGHIYEVGKGVPKDIVESYVWLDLATAHEGNSFRRDLIAKERDRVAANLTPDQLTEGQRRAGTWKPKQ